VRQRPDLGSNSRVRTVNLQSDPGSSGDGAPGPSQDDADASAPDTAGQLVIWGTDVVISHCKARFTQFVNRYFAFVLLWYSFE